MTAAIPHPLQQLHPKVAGEEPKAAAGVVEPKAGVTEPKAAVEHAHIKGKQWGAQLRDFAKSSALYKLWKGHANAPPLRKFYDSVLFVMNVIVPLFFLHGETAHAVEYLRIPHLRSQPHIDILHTAVFGGNVAKATIAAAVGTVFISWAVVKFTGQFNLLAAALGKFTKVPLILWMLLHTDFGHLPRLADKGSDLFSAWSRVLLAVNLVAVVVASLDVFRYFRGEKGELTAGGPKPAPIPMPQTPVVSHAPISGPGATAQAPTHAVPPGKLRKGE